MNLVHLHLLLNHVPVIGAVFGLILLGFALLRNSNELVKSALITFTVLGAVAVVVYLTGEPAEDSIDQLPGFSKSITERHEEIALVATVLMAAFGALTLSALVVYRRRALPRGVAVIALVAAIGVTGVIGYTANLGGQIRHTEIRSGSSVDNGAGQATAEREQGEQGQRR